MRIDLLLSKDLPYSAESYFSRKVAAIFEKKKIPCKTVHLESGIFQEYLHDLQASPPTFTLSFVDPIEESVLLCDRIRTPHFYWTTEMLLGAASRYLSSSYGKLGVLDRSCADRKALFLPPGVGEKKTPLAPFFDVVSFQAYHSHALEGVRLDLFGDHCGENLLASLDGKEVYLHAPLPFSEHFEVLRRSKIVLIDHPEGFDGCDPWFFPALQAGCLPLANPIPYLCELFGREAPLFYQTYENLLENVSYYLSQPKERAFLVSELQEKAQKTHTWEQQLEKLIEFMT